ncbi:MAG: tryptophan synthase subunit beta, partial [Candidatus Competibacteraceae bacterium]|nr:tryptophan synthase subunit beta [Candidatus Competibacteraceae bacterium]
MKVMQSMVNFSQFPDQNGHFGRYGGRFVAETLMEALHELNEAWQECRNDPDFLAELDADLAR